MLRVTLLGGMAASAQKLLVQLATTPLAVTVEESLHPRAASAAIRDAHVVVTPLLTAEMLGTARSLRLVQVTGAGTDKIDMDALPSGVQVCNCHGHVNAMAEFALGAMLILSRNLHTADRRLRSGDWAMGASFGPPHGIELHGRHLGLVGAGEAARGLPPIARAMAMSVSVITRTPKAAAERMPVSVPVYGFDDLPRLLPELDYLVLAVPLSPLTYHLIGTAELAAMKPTAILVNMARGPVVDEAALYSALSSGVIRGAAIDVWSRRPANAPDRLPPSTYDFAALDNVLITPHLAGWTEESRINRWRTIADNIDRLHAGKPLTNVVRAG